MHELGIVTHVAKTLDELAKENHLAKIGSVTLQVGEVSGIITDYFVDCWNYFKRKDPLIQEAELKLEEIKAVTYCEDCAQEYETVRYGRICPYCHSEHTYLVTGNECIIKEIEAEEEKTDTE
ncbi:MAG: hydrogenase maturation nickel metallochaperone HypA [Erysipelotrichaceae bacterium]|jgi:hydrogenase nickel incorporation protein HypA/HybF|nr:hydrogenase maturation nickel metallochaperone HypA [Erysipelotrichaceae bacterium]